MTGYQEVMTDPSYAKQIVTFTFRTSAMSARTMRIWRRTIRGRSAASSPGRDRAVELPRGAGFRRLDAEQRPHRPVRIDTRALTRRIREGGAPNGVIAHSASGRFDVDALLQRARDWPGLEGMDLAREVSCRQMFRWSGGRWAHGRGYGESPLPSGEGTGVGQVILSGLPTPHPNPSPEGEGLKRPHVVAIDYGSKRNIFRNLADAGADVTVLPPPPASTR
jgi:carbamoyl-phosphate synthase small subunit